MVDHHTPEPLNCRGIINPNYPGFQHLAHTLSEHFFDEHHFAHSSEDSDLSEFETDHSDPALMNSSGNIRNTHNPFLNAVAPSTSAHCDTLNKIEEIIRGAFKSRDDDGDNDDDEHNTDQKQKSVREEMDFCDAGPPLKEDFDEDGDECGDQSQYISYTMLDSSGEPSLDTTHLPPYTAHFNIDDCTVDAPDQAIRQITPDILQKTNLLKMMNVGKTVVLTTEDVTSLHSPDAQPDILQNVVGPHCRNSDGNNDAMPDVEVEDIVGNFEMEVEHELGRVVPGYRSVLDEEESDEEQLLRNVQQVQETIDCLMSNAEKMERSLEKVCRFISKLSLSLRQTLLNPTCARAIYAI